METLKTRDRNLTVAYLYPWHPDICAAPFEGVPFASIPASATPARKLADAGLGRLYTLSYYLSLLEEDSSASAVLGRTA